MEFKHHRWVCVQSRCLGWYGFRFGYLCSGLMPLLFFEAMIRHRCPYLSVHRPSTSFCSDPNHLQNFRFMLDPKLHFELSTLHPHHFPKLMPRCWSLPLAWLSNCNSHSFCWLAGRDCISHNSKLRTDDSITYLNCTQSLHHPCTENHSTGSPYDFASTLGFGSRATGLTHLLQLT